MAQDAILAIPRIHWITFSITIFGLLFLDLGRRFVNPAFQQRFRLPLPLELFLVIISITTSTFFKLHANYGVKIVKTVPQGLPMPQLPAISILPVIWHDVLSISIICFIFPFALAKIFGSYNLFPIKYYTTFLHSILVVNAHFLNIHNRATKHKLYTKRCARKFCTT
jgi:MFS superfamily sulfate permease-like transporter